MKNDINLPINFISDGNYVNFLQSYVICKPVNDRIFIQKISLNN